MSRRMEHVRTRIHTPVLTHVLHRLAALPTNLILPSTLALILPPCNAAPAECLYTCLYICISICTSGHASIHVSVHMSIRISVAPILPPRSAAPAERVSPFIKFTSNVLISLMEVLRTGWEAARVWIPFRRHFGACRWRMAEGRRLTGMPAVGTVAERMPKKVPSGHAAARGR